MATPESLAPAAVTAYVLADLALILLMARLVGGVFVRFGQPRVVGEIVAGLLLGPTVLGGQLGKAAVTELGRPAVAGEGLVNDIFPAQSFAFLALFATLALVLYMFMVGLDVRREALRLQVPKIGAVSAAVLLVPVALGFALGALLDDPGKWRVELTPEGLPVSYLTHSLFLGAALAVTAFPIMSRVMQEKRLLDSPVGAIGVGAAAVVTPGMFIVVAIAVASAKEQGVPQTLAVKIGLALVLAAAVLGPVRAAVTRLCSPGHDPANPLTGEVFAALLVGALATALVADRIGIHALSGGFLFGLAVPRLPGLVDAVLSRLREFVLIFMFPVFVALAGLQTDLSILRPEHIAGIMIFLAALLLAKWQAGAVASRAVGLTWTEGNLLGSLMNCRGLMILVVALIGRDVGVVTDPLLAAFMAGAIVTTLMTGPLADRYTSTEGEDRARQESVAATLSDIPAMSGGPRVLVSLAGADPGSALAAAEELAGSGEPAPQFLIAEVVGLDEGGDYVGAGPAEAGRVVARASRRLEMVSGALRATGADAAVACFQSPEPDRDLALLAEEWAATGAVTGSEAEQAELAKLGIEARVVAA